MTPTRDAFVQAAASASGLLRDPAVAASWDSASVLKEFSVAGLAGHLARQVLAVPVLGLLTRLAVRRHGPTAVLRALCRSERAPATIAAF